MSTSIPRTTDGVLKQLIADYDKIADAGDEIIDDAVAEVRDIGTDTAQRQKKFLAEIGVLRKDGWDYFLTEEGKELGNYLRFNQDTPAKEVLRQLLADWELTEEILSHFESKGMDREELKNKIGFVTSTELGGERRESGAGAIADLYEWVDILEESVTVGTGLQTVNVNTALEVSGDDSPENVRQLLLAIRAGTEQKIDRYEVSKVEDGE